jgi:hypothetical protein
MIDLRRLVVAILAATEYTNLTNPCSIGVLLNACASEFFLDSISLDALPGYISAVRKDASKSSLLWCLL